MSGMFPVASFPSICYRTEDYHCVSVSCLFGSPLSRSTFVYEWPRLSVALIVIPAMDILDERLTSDSLNRTRFDVSIRVSLGIAKRTLNRYYNMTDSSEVYRIAMGESY